jgi:hypothetical protein
VTETPPQAGRTAPWRRPAVLVPVAALLVVAAGVALAVFQPWRLFVDETVDEALPAASASVSAAPSAPAASAPNSPEPSASVSVVEELASGTFLSHEHATSGTVRLLRLPDGSRVVRLEGLDTSSGPDLRVWLSDQPVVDGPSGWTVFDDGAYADLGSLKGNKGNQNYVVPADVDLDALTSVSIWCARFKVSFGAAELRA